MPLEEMEADPAIGRSVIDSIVEWNTESGPDEGTVVAVEGYLSRVSLKVMIILAAVAIIVLTTGIAITYGAYDIGFIESYTIIWDHLFGQIGDITKDRIVVDLRLPRILGGVVAGAGLAVCGVVLQSVLRNPLADPYTTGISSGASLGAVLAMVSDISIVNSQWNMVAMAFVFSLIPLGLMVMVSRMRSASTTTVIMAGLGVMYLFNAITTVLMLLTDPNNLARVYRWQVGTLDNVAWSDLIPMAIMTLVGIVLVMVMSKRLNVLATGDETARGMGLDVERTRTTLLLLVGLVTATVVSFTGIIGFVGLVIPHIARMFVGADNRFLIPASAALGGAILVIADLIGRWVIAPTILQVGVIMSFIGGPVFVWLVIRKSNQVWG